MTVTPARQSHQTPVGHRVPSAIPDRTAASPAGGVAAALLLGALAVNLGGCGFQLQGTGLLPEAVETTYLESSNRYSEFHRSLTDALRARASR